MCTQHTAKAQGKHTAGAFDIRTFIGSLLAIYGVILTLMGLFGDKALDKTGGVNANLWAGIGLLVVGIFFVTWARLKPIVVDEAVVEAARHEKAEMANPHA